MDQRSLCEENGARAIKARSPIMCIVHPSEVLGTLGVINVAHMEQRLSRLL